MVRPRISEKNKPRLKDSEKEYIRANCLTKSDQEIADDLNRHVKTISYYRQKIGIKKRSSGTVDAGDVKKIVDPKTIVPSLSMSEHERREFFKAQLSNSSFYKTLKSQFTQEEMDYYLEEWGSLAAQFSDVISTEKRQIDEFIKAEILGNRILRSIRLLEDEINQLAQEIEDFRKKNDVTTDEVAQQRDQTLVLLCQRVVSQVTSISSTYEKSVTLRNRILEELNARRKDRTEAIRNSGNTLMGLIESFRNQDVRETQGRHLELVKLAKNKKMEASRVPRKFLNGEVNSILLDSEAVKYHGDNKVDAIKEQYSPDNILNKDASEVVNPEITELTKEAEELEKEVKDDAKISS